MENAYYNGLMGAVGYRRKDIEKPVIGVVNSWNDVNPGHRPFRELAQYVKDGVWAAGGTPAEFTVPAPCDGMAQLRGMQYILPPRPSRQWRAPTPLTVWCCSAPATRSYRRC